MSSEQLSAALETLERIAAALERIATQLEPETDNPTIHSHLDTISAAAFMILDHSTDDGAVRVSAETWEQNT